jgi:hypothetical protein
VTSFRAILLPAIAEPSTPAAILNSCLSDDSGCCSSIARRFYVILSLAADDAFYSDYAEPVLAHSAPVLLNILMQ